MAAVNRNRKFFLLLLLRMRIKERYLFSERKLKGKYNLLVKDMKLFDLEYFFQQFRMMPTQLEELLHFEMYL